MPFFLLGVFFGGWDLVLWISIAPKKGSHGASTLSLRLQLRRVSHGYGKKDDEEFELLKAVGRIWLRSTFDYPALVGNMRLEHIIYGPLASVK